MKAPLILFTLFLLSLNAPAQSFLWAKSIGGAGTDWSNSMSVDVMGNVYTTGAYTGTVDLDPGAGTFNLSGSGIFISKLNASGNFVWAKTFVGSSQTIGASIAVDGAGNVYTTGVFYQTVDFDPGTATFNMTALSGYSDIFISKLDSSGKFLWAKSVGGLNDDYGNSLALDDSGNVYLTGSYLGTADFDPGAATYNLSSLGSYDLFVLKLNASGNFLWAKSIGGTTGYAEGYSITVDRMVNVLTTGRYYGTADFDPGTGVNNLSSLGPDVFVSKLDASGNFLWARSLGGINEDIGISIAADASGNVYTSGVFKGTADFNPGAGTFNMTSSGDYDIFISKLDSSGNFLWAKRLGGAGIDYGYSMTLDGSGNTYATGSFMGTVDFDPGAGTNNLTAVGVTYIFISKLDASGNLVWAKSMGGTSNGLGRCIIVDGAGNVYLTGYFMGISDFDPGAGTFNLTSAGSWDIFITKLSKTNVGINESANHNLFTVFPNPALSRIQVKADAGMMDATFTICDAIGRVVLSGKLNSERTGIDIGSLSNGIYFFTIEGSAGHALKLIKQ